LNTATTVHFKLTFFFPRPRFFLFSVWAATGVAPSVSATGFKRRVEHSPPGSSPPLTSCWPVTQSVWTSPFFVSPPPPPSLFLRLRQSPCATHFLLFFSLFQVWFVLAQRLLIQLSSMMCIVRVLHALLNFFFSPTISTVSRQGFWDTIRPALGKCFYLNC